jgi:hypothetical protein
MTTLNDNYSNLSNQKLNINNNENVIKLNNIDISKPQSMELNSNILKDIKKNNNLSNDKNKNNINFRSIEFYALGKVNNYKKINHFIPNNNGFRSTSNNLLKRNYFSINNRIFDDLKDKNPKKQATIYEQNIDENNYLTPLNVFNSFQRYDLPSNVVNQETYNIAKEKLFAKDIFSTIKKGNHISRNDFVSQKQNLLGSSDTKDNKFLTPNNNRSINDDNIREFKRYKSCINIMEENRDKKYNEINKEKNNDKKLINSSSSRAFVPKNPKDFTKEILANTIIHFDKNHTNIVRDRNWWKINK